MSAQHFSSHARAGEVARTTPVVRDGGGVEMSKIFFTAAATPSTASRSPSPAKRVRKGAAP
jgi:hypothetical protein